MVYRCKQRGCVVEKVDQGICKTSGSMETLEKASKRLFLYSEIGTKRTGLWNLATSEEQARMGTKKSATTGDEEG